MTPWTCSTDEALKRIAEIRKAARPDRCVLIAITGIDGCGKGYVASQWRDRLAEQGRRVGLIGVDGWLNLPAKRFGGPDAEYFYLHALRFDQMFSQLILPLRKQRSIRLEADFADETATTYRRVIYEFHDLEIILLEGIYLLKRALRAYYDASFWIECSFDTALERAICRAQENLSAEKTREAYLSIYFPAQEIHLLRDNPKSFATGVVVNDGRLDEHLRF